MKRIKLLLSSLIITAALLVPICGHAEMVFAKTGMVAVSPHYLTKAFNFLLQNDIKALANLKKAGYLRSVPVGTRVHYI